MSKRKVKDIAASVRQRLYDLSRRRGDEFQLVLTHYAIERLLYRLSKSPHADRFVLKGSDAVLGLDGQAVSPHP